MLVIGLVGGVASGKSFVARCFESLGAEVLNADEIGHQILALPAVIAEIRSAWPQVVLLDGTIDRQALAKIVFRTDTPTTESAGRDRPASPQIFNQPLTQLEKITHPAIGICIDQRLSELRAASQIAAVLDAPVLFKAGWQSRCDKIVFVDADLAQRQKRAVERGWPADEIDKREQFQTTLLFKRQNSTDILNNSNSKQETVSQVRQLWLDWGLQLPDEILPTEQQPNN
jgi:dephospho-CoA kinase